MSNGNYHRNSNNNLSLKEDDKNMQNYQSVYNNSLLESRLNYLKSYINPCNMANYSLGGNRLLLSNTPNYSRFSNPNVIDNFNQQIEKQLLEMFENNQKNLTEAFKLQNTRNYSECADTLSTSLNDFYSLSKLLDKVVNLPSVLKENRELAVLDGKTFFNQNFLNNQNSLLKNKRKLVPRPKQCKSKWTEEEENKFKEGLELYGIKSKSLFLILISFFRLDFKAIAQHIGTRKLSQVRSHHQKIQLRLQKLEQNLSNNMNYSTKNFMTKKFNLNESGDNDNSKFNTSTSNNKDALKNKIKIEVDDSESKDKKIRRIRKKSKKETK